MTPFWAGRIPIVFAVNQDPVALGLVANLARLGGNATGINYFTGELIAKRLELLRELVRAAKHVGVLVNPNNVANTQTTLRDVDAAARPWSCTSRCSTPARSKRSMRPLPSLARDRPDALFVGGDTLFTSRRIQFALLEARHALPATYANRDYPTAGGLMSYGSNVTDYFRQVGIPHPQGRQARRFTGVAVEQAGAGHQRPGRQGPRPNCARQAPGRCRLGDRVGAYFAAVHKSSAAL